MPNKELRSLKGLEVLILRDVDGMPHTMRIPDGTSVDGYIDAEIFYDDLKVKLLDDDVVLRQRDNGDDYVGYSNKGLLRRHND